MNKLLPNFNIERYGLQVRLVTEDDAEFIVRLRTDVKHSRFINKIDESVEKQRNWILEYKERESKGIEYYFVFSMNENPIGVYRLYNISNNMFVCGSWVFSSSAPAGAGILGCIIGREIAYEDLELERCFTDVVKENISSLKFQLAFEPILLKEEKGLVYFEHKKENFYMIKSKFINICTSLLKTKKNG